MPIEVKDTLTSVITVLDEGISINDILHALAWVRKEKARQKNKHKKYYKPNGNPMGRPKKNPPVEIKIE